MLNKSDPIVRLKLDVLRAAMPADSAIVFGDMYIVEGAYTVKCMEYGCRRAVLVDSLETPGWLKTRIRNPGIDFYKGDFSDPLFMRSIRERFSISVAFDILLHQPPLLATLHLILERTVDAIAIVQPVLKERELANTLVYLPGQTEASGLYPLRERSDNFRVFDALEVNQSHWIWGMTASLIHSVLGGEGFDVVYEAEGDDLENPAWRYWGCVARRVRDTPSHWSRTAPTGGLFDPTW